MELKDLHEEVFKFLLEKRKADPSLRYTLRNNNNKEKNEKVGKLDKGYWFLGGDKLYISFWNVYGVVENVGLQHPAIRFEIDASNGQSKLFIDPRGCKSAYVLGEIAVSLELSKQTGIDWTMGLEDFVTTQRPFINSFFRLRRVENDFPSFSETEFSARFDKIQKLREKLARQKDALMFADFIEHKKKKLFVETLKLTNINAFKSLDISFNKQVTCFIGGNGSGKTTILRAITLGLVGIDGLKNPPKLLAISEAQKDVIKYQKEGSIDVFYQYEKEAIQDFGVEYRSFDNGKAASEPQNSKEQGGLFVKDNNALKTLVVGFAQQSDAETRISERESPNMDDLEALIVNNPDNRFEEFAKWFRIGLNKPDSKDFRVLISKIISIINACIRKNEEGDAANDIDFVGTTEIYLKTQNNPKGIPIDKLSQGYRNLLAWVGFFAKRMHEYHLTLIDEGVLPESINFMDLPAVCLIDEIDTYLHPDWQYSILKGLVESFPNVQFFITSHSPFVLTSVPSDKITIYDLHTEGGEIVVREIEENLSGADANRATDKISSHRSKRPLKLFKLLQNHIDNNRLDDAEQILNQLIEDEKVDENRDLEILRAKRLIRTKKLLQSTKPATL